MTASCSTVDRMRRTPALCLLAAATLAVAGCTSDPAASTESSDVTIPTGSTEPVPGSCDPVAEALPAPSIVIDGTSTDSTFGIGAYECGTISGEGYIVFSFNPVLLDAEKPIQVRINSGASAKLSWSLGEPFTETDDGVWKSATPMTGCARLQIDLTSPGGANTSTFGADIRVGGESVDCPQRTIDASDPGDISTAPSPTPVERDTVPPEDTTDTAVTNKSVPTTSP
jgi:hypothetical protein